MNELQVRLLLDFIDEHWVAFEVICKSFKEDPEEVRSKIEEITVGE